MKKIMENCGNFFGKNVEEIVKRFVQKIVDFFEKIC